MMRKDLRVAVVVGVIVLAMVVAVPFIVDARPAYEIPVHYATGETALQSPTGSGWAAVAPVAIPLSSAGAAVPDGQQTSIEEVSVGVARTDEKLYVRMRWQDPTADTSTEAIRSFADAAAIQIPRNESARPPIAMGSTDNMVNVWYWNGANTTEELLAGGAGSTTAFEDRRVRTQAVHRDGYWQVVFSRPLAAGQSNRTNIPTNEDMDVAVAVWNGSNMERSGRKATSQWYYLSLGPGPAGPPYEAILWTIAGIAIVVTTLITIEGIRRTRGQ